MTHTEQWIKDMIGGGYKNVWYENCPNCSGSGGIDEFRCSHCSGNGRSKEILVEEMIANIEIFLLDKEAWEAVGKTRNWCVDEGDWRRTGYTSLENWRDKQHQFITHLQDGLSIEEALEEISL